MFYEIRKQKEIFSRCFISHENHVYAGVTVVGLLRGLQSRIYMINLEQTNQPHHHQVLPHHPNQVPRMQPHHQRCFKKSVVSDSRYVILQQGTKTKTNFNSIPTDKVFNLPNIQWKEAS